MYSLIKEIKIIRKSFFLIFSKIYFGLFILNTATKRGKNIIYIKNVSRETFTIKIIRKVKSLFHAEYYPKDTYTPEFLYIHYFLVQPYLKVKI